MAPHLGSSSLQVALVGQGRDWNSHEVGVAEIFRAIGEHPLGDFGDQVHVGGGVVRHPCEIFGKRIFHAQQLHEGYASRARWRCRHQRVVAPAYAQGFAPNGAIGRQIGVRDEPVATPHFGHDEICGATGIKTRRAALRDPLQRACQLRLFESTITDFAEVLGEIRFAGVIGKRLGHAVDQGLRGDEAVARQSNVLRHWLALEHSQASAAQLQALLVQVKACTTRGHHIDIKVGRGFVRRDGAVLRCYNP
ncbi:MAG: hypothetical protein EB021_09935 [Gammaproteobacteria bacterium]|nr:hypothetical protein [Gammaproteobacteria bacterium]